MTIVKFAPQCPVKPFELPSPEKLRRLARMDVRLHAPPPCEEDLHFGFFFDGTRNGLHQPAAAAQRPRVLAMWGYLRWRTVYDDKYMDYRANFPQLSGLDASALKRRMKELERQLKLARSRSEALSRTLASSASSGSIPQNLYNGTWQDSFAWRRR